MHLCSGMGWQGQFWSSWCEETLLASPLFQVLSYNLDLSPLSGWSSFLQAGSGLLKEVVHSVQVLVQCAFDQFLLVLLTKAN